MREKECLQCGENKPISEFHKHGTTKDGYQHICKNCSGSYRIIVVDEIGRRHGRLLVIEQAGNQLDGHAQWLCKCDCGSETVVRGTHLRQKRIASCGCLQDEARRNPEIRYKLPKGEASLNNLLLNYKNKANKKSLVWDIDREQFRLLTQQLCHYCGTKPKQVHPPGGRYNGPWIYNGLDRIDNKSGYTLENVVPCCSQCNWGKRDKTVENFLSWVERIHRHNIREGKNGNTSGRESQGMA